MSLSSTNTDSGQNKSHQIFKITAASSNTHLCMWGWFYWNWTRSLTSPALAWQFWQFFIDHYRAGCQLFFSTCGTHLFNKLPHFFREPHPHPGLSPSHYPTQVGSTLSSPPLSPSITPSLFTLDLKHTSSSSLFHRRLHHIYSVDWSHGLLAGTFFLLIGFVSVSSSRLSVVD